MAYVPPLNGGRINATISGNTAGTGSLVSTGTMVLAGGNNITLSQNGNSITFSGGSQSAQTQNIIQGVIAGTSTASSGSVSFANSNGVSFGLSGNTLTASAAGGGGGGVAIAGGGTTISSGTAQLSAAGGALTITGSTNSVISLSVPAQSNIVGTNGIKVSTSGSTISIDGSGIQAGGTLSRWEYPEEVFGPLSTVPQGQLSIQHMYVPFNVTGTAAKLGGSLSAGTGTSATTGQISASLWMGIYTLSGSTLSLATSGSANNNFSVYNTSATTANTSINGMRQLTVPMNVNMTPGEYWMAAALSTATNYASNTMAFTIYGNSAYPTSSDIAAPILMPIGSGVAAARDVKLFEGIYTAATNAGPASIVGSQINNTAASNVMRANFYNAIYNATY